MGDCVSVQGSFQFDNVLLQTSLNFNDKITVITGDFGSGKSELLRVLSGKYQSTGDSVIKSFRNCTYFSQAGFILPTTIRKNILFFRKQNRTMLK